MSTSEANEPHTEVLAAAVAGAAATMLTLLTVLGSTNLQIISNTTMKALFESQLIVLETALIFGTAALMRKSDAAKALLAKTSAVLLIGGTLLLWLSATILIGVL
jgi:hypothetical protein